MFKRLLTSRYAVLFVAIVLIVFGVFAMVRYTRGALDAYRVMEYARANDFDAGNVDPALIRPWMNLRFVAVAYAVPQEYFLEELGIHPPEGRGGPPDGPPGGRDDREFTQASLDRLNERLRLGNTNGEPALLPILRAAILRYRENPVATGMTERGVRPWMNMQYIANSTGIPIEAFFEAVGVPSEGNAYIPLERLADELQLEGGLESLMDAVRLVIDTYEAPQ
jgi:hypothetical protein